jgi:hypothetical protein
MMRPAYSQASLTLARELAEKAAHNLRQSGWSVSRDERGHWICKRPEAKAEEI